MLPCQQCQVWYIFVCFVFLETIILKIIHLIVLIFSHIKFMIPKYVPALRFVNVFLCSTGNAPVSCNPCPARTPPPHAYRDGRGIAGLMCGTVTFWVPRLSQLSAGLVTLCKYTPVEFTVIKSRAMTLSRSPQCRAFSRAVMDNTLLSRGWHKIL